MISRIKNIGRRTVLVAAAATLATFSGTVVPSFSGAQAQSYPDKPIKLFIGFRAGGGFDSMATVLIPELEKTLGQPVVKEIHPGGGGAKATALLKSQAADGYSIALTISASVAFNPVFVPDKTPYRYGDFDYLASLAGSGESVMAKADAPFDTWTEMLEYAKAGNDLSYSGQTPFDRLLVKYLNKNEGINIVHVPTKGGSEAIKNILGGHTDLSFSGGNHLKHFEEGTIKFIASLRPDRITALPDVPSLAELGYPIDFGNTAFIMAPKGLPDNVKAKLRDAVNAARESEAFQAFLAKTPYFEIEDDEDAIIVSLEAQLERNTKMIADAAK